MVKRALSIYAMHYVLTRHLCITPASIEALAHTNLLPRNVPWLTPRVLNRQIKSLLDEHLLKEMQHLFDGFSRSLKPKSRGEWAPCLAAFLVLCLFMETVEAAADEFVTSQVEVGMRDGTRPEHGRTFALQACREVENLPFKQFAYQFHQVYQTHTRDASARAFNPLVDDSFAEQGDLDMPASEMVTSLKELLSGDSCEFSPFPFFTVAHLGNEVEIIHGRLIQAQIMSWIFWPLFLFCRTRRRFLSLVMSH